MKLKVTKRYVDRYTKKFVEEGTFLDNVPEARAKELLAQKVVEVVKEPETKTKKEKVAPEQQNEAAK